MLGGISFLLGLAALLTAGSTAKPRHTNCRTRPNSKEQYELMLRFTSYGFEPNGIDRYFVPLDFPGYDPKEHAWWSQRITWRYYAAEQHTTVGRLKCRWIKVLCERQGIEYNHEQAVEYFGSG